MNSGLWQLHFSFISDSVLCLKGVRRFDSISHSQLVFHSDRTRAARLWLEMSSTNVALMYVGSYFRLCYGHNLYLMNSFQAVT